jgi:O-antigen ligase/Tfp pilus assembly protein PilF
MASLVQSQGIEGGQLDLSQRLRAFIPVLVVLALFKLTISGAGWELDSLSLVQTAVFVLVGVVLWTGGIRRVAVGGPLLAMVLAVALTAIWSVRPEASVRALTMWMMYGGIFIVVASTLTFGAHAGRVIDGALAIGAWICLLALSWRGHATLLGGRWYGSFYWPNPFAAFLLLLIPVTLMRLIYGRSRRETLALGVITMVLLVAFILTYSRGAWVVLAGVTLLTLIVMRPPSKGIALQRTTAVIVMAVLVSVVLASRVDHSSEEGLFARAASITNIGNESVQGRLSFWRSAIAIFRDHPLVGTGPWTYGIAHTRYQDDVRFYASDAHNLYLQTAAEMGLVGLAVLVTLLIAIVALWIRTLRIAHGLPEYPLVAGVGLGLLGFFVHSALEVNWAFPANPALAFAMLGALAGYEASFTRSPSGSAHTLALRPRLAATLVVLLAIAAVQTARAAQHAYVEGQRLVDIGQWQAGTAELARAARLNPLHPDYVVTSAIAAARSAPQGSELVIEAIHRARAMDRMNATHPVQEAIRLMAQGPRDPNRAQAAETLLRQALILDPFNDPIVYRILAQLYLRQGRPDAAAAVYRSALPLYLGHGLGRGGLFYEAQWRKVLVLVVDDAELATQRGHRDEPVEVLRSALNEDPGAIPVAVRLGALYAAMGRPIEARAVLAAAAAQAPDNPEIRAALDALR